MTTVFISGSRTIHKVNQDVINRLMNILTRNLSVVVGDATGGDKAVQQYFSKENYPHLTVFCAGNTCRHNLGNWPITHVQVAPTQKGRDFYLEKDKEMAATADYGFVIWDGKSPGSYRNVLELLKRNKKTLVYHNIQKAFITIGKIEEAKALLTSCDTNTQEEIKRKIKFPSLLKEIESTVQGSLLTI